MLVRLAAVGTSRSVRLQDETVNRLGGWPLAVMPLGCSGCFTPGL